MKKLLLFPVAVVFFLSCSNNKKKEPVSKNTRVALYSDIVNVAKLTDTLVIYESTCRGCAYETSTHFSISDSLGIVKLSDVITTDNNSANVDGGSISKDLILLPLRTGSTTIKLYKFWKAEETAEDSAKFTSYKIEVQN